MKMRHWFRRLLPSLSWCTFGLHGLHVWALCKINGVLSHAVCDSCGRKASAVSPWTGFPRC